MTIEFQHDYMEAYFYGHWQPSYTKRKAFSLEKPFWVLFPKDEIFSQSSDLSWEYLDGIVLLYQEELLHEQFTQQYYGAYSFHEHSWNDLDSSQQVRDDPYDDETEALFSHQQ